MKYKLLRFSLLSVLVMLLTGWAQQVRAEDEVYYTLDGTTTGGNSNYAQDGGGLTQNDIAWSVTGNTTMNPWRIGGKDITDVDREAYSKTAMGSAITKVELEIGDINLEAVNSITLIVASDAEFTSVIETLKKTEVTANSTLTFSPSSTEWATNAYYKFVFNITQSASSNKYIQLKSAKFYKKADASDTRTATTVELADGYATTGEVGGRIALPRYSVKYGEGSVLESATVTWESSDTEVATIDAANSLISLKAAGTTTIKATYAGDETYKSSTASYTLTVTPQTVNITSLRELQNRVTTTSTPANITFRDIQVVYVNGSNAFLADANGYGTLIYTKNHGLEAGQVLNGTIKANIVLYQGNAEITDFSKEGLTITEAEVTPTVTTIDAIHSKAEHSGNAEESYRFCIGRWQYYHAC